MLFKNTACLATLLLSFPLVAPYVCRADSSSGNDKVFDAGTYNSVVIGQAINTTDASLTELKANDNKATFKSGAIVDAVNGGYAGYEITSTAEKVTVQANNNTLTFKSGSIVKGSVYAGQARIDTSKKAVVNGTFECIGNTIIIENGAKVEAYTTSQEGTALVTISAGQPNSEKSGNGDLISQSNTLTIDASAFTGTESNPLKFRHIRAAGAGANTGNVTVGASEKGKTDQGNTLTITNLSNATIERVSVAEASSHEGGVASATGGIVTVRHNTGNVEFGDNVKVTEIYGGKADGGSAIVADNTLSVSGGETTSAYGAYANANNENATAIATDNALTVSGGKAELEYAACAYASKGSAIVTGNTLAVSDSNVNLLSGGFANGVTAKAEGNKGTVSNTSAEEFSGGMAVANGDDGKAEALSNEFEVKGGTLATVYGGMAASTGSGSSATAEGNNLTLTDAEVTKDLYGGYACSNDSDASASENTLSLNGGSYSGNIYGGYAEATGTAKALNNTVELNKSEAGTPAFADTTVLYGGYAATSTGNTLKFNNVLDMTAGNIKNFQTLTYTYDELHAGDVILTLKDASGTDISNATVSVTLSKIYGKEDGSEFAIGDTVILLKNENGLKTDGIVLNEPVITSTDDMYTGYVLALQTTKTELLLTSTGTSLNFSDATNKTKDKIEHFQELNYTYSVLNADDVILTVTGEEATDVSKTHVNVRVSNIFGKDGGEFKIGDKVYLLRNLVGGLNTEGIVLNKPVLTGQTGISLQYYLELQTAQDESGKDIELILTRTEGSDAVQPGTKAIAEGAAAGLALVNESSNAAIEALRDFSMASGTIAPFVHVQASSMRHETGSSVNVSSVSLVAGLGTGIDTGAGNLSLGAFFEYGKGSYTTHNSSDSRSDIDGDGNSWYMGGGILAKMDFVPTGPGYFYVEGSAHMGSLHNEYDSNDLYDSKGNVAKFDMDSPYYSLHGGLGYVWNMAEGHDLDVYGKYIWTRVQGTDDTLTTSDKFEYDDMDSNRIRLGARYTYNGSERFVPYVGAAFEHEFSGSCDSRAFGHSVAAPSFEGSSGMGELGLMMKPAESLPLSVNLGVQGYLGQKQGVSGNCSVMYEF